MFLIRYSAAIILIACTFMSNNMIEIVRFAGSVTMPIICVILPIVLKYLKKVDYNEKVSYIWMVHDLLLLSFGVSCIIIGIWRPIKDPLLDF